MCTVNRDAVETHFFGHVRGLGVGFDNPPDVIARHFGARDLSHAQLLWIESPDDMIPDRPPDTGSATGLGIRVGANAAFQHGAHVPKLRKNDATGFVNAIDHVSPGGPSRIAMHDRYISVIDRRGVVDAHA